MYSRDDLNSVYGFLRSTGEGNLKKMLVGGKMTDMHFRMLIKIVRGCSEDDFIKCLEQASFPKVKFNGPEMEAKETFWPIALQSLGNVGLLQPAKQAA